MQLGEAAPAELRPRFPALDPEPPRRPWRLAVPVIVVVAVAIAAVLGYVATRPGRPASTAIEPSRGSPFSGLILAQTPSGVLSLTDVHTGRFILLKKLGQFASNPPPSVSPDHKYIVDPAVSVLLSLADPAQPAQVRNSLSFPAYTNLSVPDPFSNHDKSILIQNTELGSLSYSWPYSVQSVQTGHSARLGVGDDAAGDPQAPGAFIGYARPNLLTPPHGVFPDTSVQLWDVGARHRILATSLKISRLLRIPLTDGISLVPYPNPQGTMVAVQVIVIGSTANGGGGIVVFNRKGKVLGFQPVPGGAFSLAWSRTGSDLAYISSGYVSGELTEWQIGGQSTTVELHVPAIQAGPCAWSPDDLSVICDGGPHHSWLIAQSDSTYVLAGHGQLLAWLGGGLTG